LIFFDIFYIRYPRSPGFFFNICLPKEVAEKDEKEYTKAHYNFGIDYWIVAFDKEKLQSMK